MPHQYIDLRNISVFSAIEGAFETMFLRSDQDLIRVIGPAPMGDGSLEIVLEEGLLQHAMFEFSINVTMALLLMSGITGTLASFVFKSHQ